MSARLMAMKQEDGSYRSNHDCYNENALSVLGEELGWCRCGSNDEAARTLLSTLELIDDKETEYEIKERRWLELGYGKDGPRFLFLYWLDDKRLIEHGGSVIGSWLTELGHQLVSDLRYALHEQDEIDSLAQQL